MFIWLPECGPEWPQIWSPHLYEYCPVWYSFSVDIKKKSNGNFQILDFLRGNVIFEERKEIFEGKK